jgi:ketosteroid isomerase-like protein
MSQENVEILKRGYEASNQTGELSPDVFATDFVLDLTEAAPDFGVLRGIEASQQALRGYTETFDEFRVEIEEVIHADGRQVVTAVSNSGRMRGSDSQISSSFFQVFTLEDGKVVRWSVHVDRNQALEAAGLRE